MIVCMSCEEVQYFGVMPFGCAEIEKVLCYSCEAIANDYENNAFDLANDR